MDADKKVLTNQELFDRVVEFQIKQGKPAIRTETLAKCAYLTIDGLRCSVGCVFKQDPETDDLAIRLDGAIGDLIVKDRENGDWRPDDLERFLDFSPTIDQHHLLSDLQKAHDGSDAKEFVLQFVRLAANIAEKWKLNTSKLQVKVDNQ